MLSEPDSTKHGRVLACALCKHRRVKCSRTFPCTNCVRAGAECKQPALNTRRRRFPERQLLDQLRHYEDLLRRNNVAFTPLHPSSAASVVDGKDVEGGNASQQNEYDNKEAIDVWQAIKRVALYDDEDNESDAETASSVSSYDDAHERVKESVLANDHLLFGAPDPDFPLRASHPDQAQLFRLWQVYLDNVNPLLKVTHTPTLQPRIIDAASDIGSVNSAFDALLFSIYAVSVMSLSEDECQASFHNPRDVLLSRYQVACKQALLKCAPWRSNDRDCLTALYLYLTSIASQVDPRSLACMVAVAIRTAQRMGLHSESNYSISGCNILEAEMRRRLWWALVLFDHRICEIAGQEKSTILTPTWDCRPPLNINDFELQAEMTQAPKTQNSSPTESLFAVVRSELADFVRHSASYLCIISGRPFKTTESNHNGRDINSLERLVEEKYLAHCNPEVPLHYMTIWITQSFIAKHRLMEQYMTQASMPSARITDAQRNTANVYAVKILEYDAKLRASPLCRGFLWALESWYSPVLAYLHVLNNLARRPGAEGADRSWQILCQDYEALTDGPKHHRTRLMFALKFSKITLQVWETRVKWRRLHNMSPEQSPRLVLDSRENTRGVGASNGYTPSSSGAEQLAGGLPIGTTGTSGSVGMASTFPESMDFAEIQMFSCGPGFDFADSSLLFSDAFPHDDVDTGPLPTTGWS